MFRYDKAHNKNISKATEHESLRAYLLEKHFFLDPAIGKICVPISENGTNKLELMLERCTSPSLFPSGI